MPIKCAKIEQISKTLYFLDHLLEVFHGCELSLVDFDSGQDLYISEIFTFMSIN
jgi:hypothetical protein